MHTQNDNKNVAFFRRFLTGARIMIVLNLLSRLGEEMNLDDDSIVLRSFYRHLKQRREEQRNAAEIADLGIGLETADRFLSKSDTELVVTNVSRSFLLNFEGCGWQLIA